MSQDDQIYPLPEDGASSAPLHTPVPLSQDAALFAARLVRLALEEDGPDMTSLGIFPPGDHAVAKIVAKETTLVVGLPLINVVFAELMVSDPPSWWEAAVPEGGMAHPGETVAWLWGDTSLLLRAERVILNLITHLSGVANLTRRYVGALHGTGVRLLDTRKTLAGHRYLEKYAVRVAGGFNHRMNLSDMLMIKNNHVDAAGSITQAVAALRTKYAACPPLTVECRTLEETREAVASMPDRILLDNMSSSMLAEALPLIPLSIEAEISGGVDLTTIRGLALSSPTRPPDFISVGRITHSAPIADFSMRLERRPLPGRQG